MTTDAKMNYASYVQALMMTRVDWLEHLKAEFKINVNRDGDLASLKYNQIESPMHEPIVQECRGMVVDVHRRKVLAWPYNKFWNHGEVLAAPIDWCSAVVYEKLDGSLMILYWNEADGEWQVASSGTPRASGDFGNDSSRTFCEAFWATWHALGMSLPIDVDRDHCFMFEFCATENRIVVCHERPRIVLHGGRNVNTGEELAHRDLVGYADSHGWEAVRAYPIGTIDECLAASEAIDPMVAEGFVVVDARFNRIKIKSPRYVALHHMKGEATPRRAIELWQSGETDELLSHFPEMASIISPVQARLNGAAYHALGDFETHRHAETRKEFALAVKDAPWSAVTFKLYQHPSPSPDAAREILRGLSLSALERMIEGLP